MPHGGKLYSTHTGSSWIQTTEVCGLITGRYQDKSTGGEPSPCCRVTVRATIPFKTCQLGYLFTQRPAPSVKIHIFYSSHLLLKCDFIGPVLENTTAHLFMVWKDGNCWFDIKGAWGGFESDISFILWIDHCTHLLSSSNCLVLSTWASTHTNLAATEFLSLNSCDNCRYSCGC